MDREIKEIMDGLQGAVLAIEEINRSIPDVKRYLDKYQTVLASLEKNKSELERLTQESKATVELIKEQSQKGELELQKKFDDYSKTAKKVITNVEKIEKSIEERVGGISDLASLKRKIDEIEKVIKNLELKISKLDKPASNPVDAEKIKTEIEKVYEVRMALLEKKINDHQLIIQKLSASSNAASNVSASITTSSSSARARATVAPTLVGYKSFSLDSTKSVTRTKPYGIYFEDTGEWILAQHWTELSEKMVVYFIENRCNDRGRAIKDSEEKNDYDWYYFYEGRHDASKYTYNSKYNFSVFKAGSEDSIKMYKYLCKLHGIRLKNVSVYYK